MDGTGRAGSRKASKIWLVALPLMATLVAFGLWTSSKDARHVGKPILAGAASSSELDKIAIQGSDLPKGFRRCSSSGDFVAYSYQIKATRPKLYEANLARWSSLRAHGARDAYIVHWADSAEACNAVISGEAGVGSGAYSLVISFTSPETALAAYQADVFGQFSLKANPDIEFKEGDASGLGPNAVSAALPKAAAPERSAFWQNHSVNVLFGSQNLPIPQSEAITTAVNQRIP